MEPLPEDWKRAVAIVAHPDDLEYGVASGMARWTSQGKEIAWRWWTWRQEHGTLVTVQIGMAFLTLGPNLVEAITVTVYNRSRHAIRVTGIAVETNDGSKRAFAQIVPQVGATIPGVIEPHESGMTWFEKDRLLAEGGINPQRLTRCRVSLADRPGFIWSKPRRLEGKD